MNQSCFKATKTRLTTHQVPLIPKQGILKGRNCPCHPLLRLLFFMPPDTFVGSEIQIQFDRGAFAEAVTRCARSLGVLGRLKEPISFQLSNWSTIFEISRRGYAVRCVSVQRFARGINEVHGPDPRCRRSHLGLLAHRRRFHPETRRMQQCQKQEAHRAKQAERGTPPPTPHPCHPTVPLHCRRVPHFTGAIQRVGERARFRRNAVCKGGGRPSVPRFCSRVWQTTLDGRRSRDEAF